MRIWVTLLLVLSSCLGFAEKLPINQLQVPADYRISIFAAPVPDARTMALGDHGIVFVGTRQEGKIYALIPDDKAAFGHKIVTIMAGLDMPNGIAYYQGNLYVAENHRILRFDQIETHLNHPPAPTVIIDNLPRNKHHGWRYMKIGPDGKLYIAIGAPCDVCLSDDPRLASIMRMDLDGSNQEVFAHGIRNSVGFDWHPSTHALWFTDNGRDWLGDNSPPDEVNEAVKKNENFGFPYCFGKTVSDPKFGKQYPCSAFKPPVAELSPHSAALGMTFYQGDLLVAEHGSWNRSSKVGYQVVKLTLNGNMVSKIEPFVTGWLNGESVWGRPVDILIMQNGTILISDDYANVIYQLEKKTKHSSS